MSVSLISPHNNIVQYSVKCAYSAENLKKVAEFVSAVYSRFPTLTAEEREALRKERVWIESKIEPATVEECTKLQKELEKKILEIKQGSFLYLSTDYYPLGELENACKATNLDINNLGFYFPNKTNTVIDLKGNEIFLKMNFQGPII